MSPAESTVSTETSSPDPVTSRTSQTSEHRMWGKVMSKEMDSFLSMLVST